MANDKIIERALQIQNARGCSLAEAVAIAEADLAPVPSTLPEAYEITIRVKPRVSVWVQQQFGGHPTHSIEERLGLYLSGVLTRERMRAIRLGEPVAKVGKGEAVTVRRDQFNEATE